MKKFILSASLLFSALVTFSQGSPAIATVDLNSKKTAIASYGRITEGNFKYLKIPVSDTTRNADFYRNRSRNQQVAGFLFVGLGAIGLVTGLLSFPKNGDLFNDNDVSKADRAATITGIGAGLMLGSIPFFVLSGVNKRKARLSYTTYNLEKGIPLKSAGSVTGLSFSVSLGR